MPTQTSAPHADLEQMIEGYTDLRHKCYTAARADDGKLMGTDAWLRYALLERDIELQVTADGIQCSGHTFTVQTHDSEWFDFTIPFSAL